MFIKDKSNPSALLQRSLSRGSLAEMIKPVVVVPIYRPDINYYEIISLRRTFSQLGSHTVTILSPESTISCISSMLERVLPADSTYRLHVVDDHWLSSHRAYNQLMLTELFYRHYSGFSHLLVCQLDAYVFEDQLLEWCNTAFDYIGAPLHSSDDPAEFSRPLCVGVGGFSLRRIDAFLLALSANPQIFRTDDLLERIAPFNLNGKLYLLIRFIISRLKGECRLAVPGNRLAFSMGINEDVLYAKHLPRHFPAFNVADAHSGLAFSIDKQVEESLSILGGRLPFAAHAWWTFQDNLQAWKPLIQELV